MNVLSRSESDVRMRLCRMVVVGVVVAGVWSEPAPGQSATELPVPPLPSLPMEKAFPENFPEPEPGDQSAALSPARAADWVGQSSQTARADPAVLPAALVTPPPQPAGRLGPVPLTDSRGLSGPTPATIRPAADWSVLAAILGAFAVLGIFRLRSRRRDRGLPTEVFDVLGAGSLGGQHAVRVVRFGPRTLLVGISSAGSQTLAEIDDLTVTESIAAACLARPTVRSPIRAPRPPRAAPPRAAVVGEEPE